MATKEQVRPQTGNEVTPNGKVSPKGTRATAEALARVRAARGSLKKYPGSVTEFLKEKRAELERES